jgi:uncharacterized repeat protein (TIGR03803 family)
MRSKKPYSPAKSIFAIFITLLLFSAIVPAQSKAQKFKVLHTFHGPDGAGPIGQLVRDQAGNLYGTAAGGGKGTCYSGYTCGTAFKLDKTGKQVWLHSFNLRNGMEPFAGLLRDAAGNLYGTTVLGGDTACYKLGCGTVFKLDQNGKEKLLYKFTGTPDAWFPVAPLIQDAAGNFYGTTQNGGTSGGLGTVFKVDKTDKETVFYSFAGGTDGSDPSGGLIRDSAGNLYGTTFDGGGSGACSFGCGTVFRLDSNGTETILYRFQGGDDGDGPIGRLLLDASGSLYGTTAYGGDPFCYGGTGCGTVFKLDTGGHESVLYRFSGGTDGQFPHAGLVRDQAGNLYGTTIVGGGGADAGVVFKLDAAGTETVLHTFTGGSDGSEPFGGLIRDSAGILYGAAEGGGDTNCFPPSGCGVVFTLTP